MNKKMISLKLDDELLHSLKVHCVTNRIYIYEFIEMAIQEKLKEKNANTRTQTTAKG